MTDGCSAAKDRDDADKATMMMKWLKILTIFRRTDRNLTGSILLSKRSRGDQNGPVVG
jgi:hypothetical protein